MRLLYVPQNRGHTHKLNMSKLSSLNPVKSLSPRQEQIRRLLLDREPLKVMASKLGISEHSVTTQKKRMAEKLEISVPELRNYFERQQIAERSIEMTKVASLEGFWISRFRFTGYDPASNPREAKYRNGCQIDLEKIQSSAGNITHTGSSICGVRADSKPPYMHELEIKAERNYVLGFWRNIPPYSSSGCFQLYLQNQLNAMEGSHLGLTSNSVVKAGEWIWLRLSPAGADTVDPRHLRSFDQLDQLFDLMLNGSGALTVGDLFESPLSRSSG
jgi:DNA-binding CsgD family transcriptional regulator